MQSSIRMERDVPTEMRDGTRLMADIFRPDDSQKHPAILIRTPYSKLLSANTDFLNVVDAAHAGYAVVIQDIRGRFSSEGEYGQGDRMSVEGPDGYDSVEWTAGQAWCDGNVGMAGGSYLAHLQWIAAMENPPHLKAIAPWIGAAWLLREQTLLGGALNLYFAASWIPQMAIDIADKLEKQGKDVSQMRKALYRALFKPEEIYNHLPLKDIPLTRFEGVREMWRSLLDFVPSASRVTEIPPHWSYHKVMVPCFHVSGWYDHHTWATFFNFHGMLENGGSRLARQGQYVLMGPWAHGGRLVNTVGSMNFGPSAGTPGAQVSELNIAFFDKYLRGVDVKLPAVRYFVMGENRWHSADAWPLPQTVWRRFYFHSMGRANTSAGDGLLTTDEPSSEPVDSFVYDPHWPVPTTGGRVLSIAGLVPGPMDQSFVEKRSDVVCYTTPELEEDMEVTGPVEAHVFATTTARDTDFTAKLVDVHPDGRSYNVAEGILRGRYRKSIFEPEFLNPGEIVKFIINMGNTSVLFSRGHRLRVDISSSNFPAFDRNMNTGSPIGEDAQATKATQSIYHQPGYASYLDLPVIPTSAR
jgi:putative CocE/NonD family hydrolase